MSVSINVMPSFSHRIGHLALNNEIKLKEVVISHKSPTIAWYLKVAKAHQ